MLILKLTIEKPWLSCCEKDAPLKNKVFRKTTKILRIGNLIYKNNVYSIKTKTIMPQHQSKVLVHKQKLWSISAEGFFRGFAISTFEVTL